MPDDIKACFNELPNPTRDDVVGLFPDTKSGGGKRRPKDWSTDVYGMKGKADDYEMKANSGSAARFFKTCPYEEGEGARFAYFPKASKKDRNEGLEEFEEEESKTMSERSPDSNGSNNTTGQKPALRANNHPTVKPTALMQYLVRLVTPVGGKVLDPFMGSGSTGKACVLEGFDFVGIELDPEYCKIAEARIQALKK